MGPSTLKLTAATAAIAVILFAANLTTTSAHQQQQQQQQGLMQLLLQQLLTSQPATVENSTTIFQSINNSFSVQVPEGWIIRDLSNTGITLAAEALRGYGLLAQLCPPEQQALPVNPGSNFSNISTSTNSSNNSCESSQEIIHVVRYPNLDARLELASDADDDDTTGNNSNIAPDTVLGFQMLKLQEVGYRDFRIVNSTDTTINVISSALNNNVIATVPAKLAEVTYSTDLVPNETRTGYFLSAATDLTPRNLGMTTGYGLFYERGYTAPEITEASSILTPPAPIIQLFDSFELMAGAEVEQAIVAGLSALAAQGLGEGQVPADVLTVEIDSSDTEGVAPAMIDFEADISGGIAPYTISWDLDDDGIAESNDQSFVATFNEAGTYDSVLTVADSRGQTASDTVEITVEEGEEELPSTGEEEELSPMGEEEELSPMGDEAQSLAEGTIQEETSCDSMYPIICLYQRLFQNLPDLQ
jgi:PKD repeat protein